MDNCYISRSYLLLNIMLVCSHIVYANGFVSMFIYLFIFWSESEFIFIMFVLVFVLFAGVLFVSDVPRPSSLLPSSFDTSTPPPHYNPLMFFLVSIQALTDDTSI